MAFSQNKPARKAVVVNIQPVFRAAVKNKSVFEPLTDRFQEAGVIPATLLFAGKSGMVP